MWLRMINGLEFNSAITCAIDGEKKQRVRERGERKWLENKQNKTGMRETIEKLKIKFNRLISSRYDPYNVKYIQL